MWKTQEKIIGTVTKPKTCREMINKDYEIVYLPVAFNMLHVENNLFRSASFVFL